MYKKCFSAAIAVASSLLVPVQADTLLGLYVGAQAWQSDVSGGFANSRPVNDFSFDNETNSSLYVALEHPVPLLPNVKIRRQTLNSSGDVLLDADFIFASEQYSQGALLAVDSNIDTMDYVLYYEIFDNDLISFDIGLNARDFDGQVTMRDTDDTTLLSSQPFSGIIPLLYSRAQFGTPIGGLGFVAEGSFLAIDDSKLYDYQAALTYQWLDNLAVDMTFQLGYRAYRLELDDVDNLYTDLDFKGPFVGLEVHF